MRKQIVKDKDISILLKGAVHLEDKDAQILLPEQCVICPEAITGEGIAFKPSGVIPPLTEVPANTVWYTNDYSGNCWGWHEGDYYNSSIDWGRYNDVTSLYIGEGLTEVSTFPPNIHYIHLPESVNHISTWAFSDQYSLRVIDMPSKVESIGSGVFANCENLKSIRVPEGVTELAYGPMGFFEQCYALEEVILPETLQNIGNGAFRGCSSLTSVTIPNSVTSIGGGAFFGCSSLTSVTIPNSVTSIGVSTFAYCSSLTSPVYNAHCFAYLPTSFEGAYIIPDSIKQIAGGAFSGCSSLTSITIPESVTSIGEEAFGYCDALTSITMKTITPPTLGNNAFPSNLPNIYIPDNTLSAYQQAWGNKYTYFNNESVLTLHIEDPGTLSDLIFNAGTSPVNIAQLTLTGTLNDDDFTCMRETMTSLADVNLSGITNTIGVDFTKKSGLKRIILPDCLTTIEVCDFQECSSLTSITIPNSVTRIGDWAFNDCCSLTSITIPNSVTRIGHYAFDDCNKLASVTIGNSVTSIGGYAFSGTAITSITIPNSVTSIGNNAFSDCNVLDAVYVEAITPPVFGNDTLDSNITAIYVPAESVEAYKTATNWSYYSDIIQAIP